MKSKIIIPDGYNQIACTEFRSAKAVAYTKGENILIIVDDSIVFGPANNYQMACALHVLTDVADMRKLRNYS